MTAEEIRYLAERVASGTATEEEIQRYNNWYNSVRSDFSEQWDEGVYGDKEALQFAMKENILARTGSQSRTLPKRINWLRWTAAAAILILISIGVVYIGKKNDHEVAQTNTASQKDRFKNDVAPGRNGAILTLSNGISILLDSVGNGALEVEEGLQVSKKEGEIIYANQDPAQEVVYHTIITPRGRQFNLVLADGTRVWLNAESSITFPTAFTGKDRKINITGEAYFEVAPNKQLPFIVEKENTKVEVLGTHFNINTYEEEASLNVTLLEGSLRVTEGAASTLINPGQQAQVRQNDIRVIDNANLVAVMAWKNGFFNFKGTDIGTLLRQLSRWYDVDVVYERKINDLFYAEIPRNTNLSDVLKALELTGKVQFAIDGKKIKVLP